MSPHPPPHPRGPGATTGLSHLEGQGSGQAQHQTPLSVAGQRGRRRASSGGHWGAAAAGNPRRSGAAAKAETLPASASSEGHAGGTTSRASWSRQVWRGWDTGRERSLFSSGILRSQPSTEALGVNGRRTPVALSSKGGPSCSDQESLPVRVVQRPSPHGCRTQPESTGLTAGPSQTP